MDFAVPIPIAIIYILSYVSGKNSSRLSATLNLYAEDRIAVAIDIAIHSYLPYQHTTMRILVMLAVPVPTSLPFASIFNIRRIGETFRSEDRNHST